MLYLNLEKLTSRETQVLDLVKVGMTNQEISLTFGISEKTVESHLRVIFQKLNANSRTEAVYVALKNDILEL